MYVATNNMVFWVWILNSLWASQSFHQMLEQANTEYSTWFFFVNLKKCSLRCTVKNKKQNQQLKKLNNWMNKQMIQLPWYTASKTLMVKDRNRIMCWKSSHAMFGTLQCYCTSHYGRVSERLIIARLHREAWWETNMRTMSHGNRIDF